jgi:hypothetical protein
LREFRGEFPSIATNLPGISDCEHFERLSRRYSTQALPERNLSYGIF